MFDPCLSSFLVCEALTVTDYTHVVPEVDLERNVVAGTIDQSGSDGSNTSHRDGAMAIGSLYRLLHK